MIEAPVKQARAKDYEVQQQQLAARYITDAGRPPWPAFYAYDEGNPEPADPIEPEDIIAVYELGAKVLAHYKQNQNRISLFICLSAFVIGYVFGGLR